MKKIYILDSTVLVDKPENIFVLKNKEVIILNETLEEINNIIKRYRDKTNLIAEKAQKARKVLKTIYDIKNRKLTKDIPYIKFVNNEEISTLEKANRTNSLKDTIIVFGKWLAAKEKNNNVKVILLTFDKIQFTMANAAGLCAEMFTSNKRTDTTSTPGEESIQYVKKLKRIEDNLIRAQDITINLSRNLNNNISKEIIWLINELENKTNQLSEILEKRTYTTLDL